MGNEESCIYSIKSDTRDNKYPDSFSILSSVRKLVVDACGRLSDTIDEYSIDSYDNSNREESLRRKTREMITQEFYQIRESNVV